MKFSSGFTAFVAASVATANLGAAAPVNNNGLATRDVSQSNSQSTSQQASGKNVHQDSDSAQHNNQGVKISKDASFQISHPAIVVPASNHPSSGSTTPSSSGSTTPATSEGEHHDSEDSKTGDLISLSLLNGNKANAQVAGTGNQSNKRSTGSLVDADALDDNNANLQILGTGNQKNVDSHKEHHDGHRDAENGDLISAILLNGNDVNAQVAGTGNQKNKRGLFGVASGKQDASADGFGGSSFQGQSNAPVLSGAGNSLTAGGAQGSQNNGQGGSITQDLLQKLQARQLFSQGKQGASANGYGGQSAQGQSNAPFLSGAGNSLTSGGLQQSQNNGQGGSIEQALSQLQSLGGFGKRQLFSSGKQGASANGQGGTSFQGQSNAPVLSGSGNSLTAGGAQGAENNGFGGSIEQTLSQLQQLGGGLGKRQLFAQGKQGASADGFGGSSAQGQTSNPVLSGSGSSLTSGGAQLGENNGQGGEIQQTLLQKLGLGKRQLFASGTQQGSADGYGGFSSQGQDNRPVVSGAGNSVTTGGSQFGQNDGTGGSVDQSIFQKLGLGERQFKAFGSQDASADGFGGSSFQYQNNRPVVSGTGNSVTAGGAQGATNNGQGGDISQQLQQLLGRRQFQGLGQGINQGIDQTGSANAYGGTAYIYGNNGPASVDGTATAGTVNQGASGQQDGAQSATQGLTQETLNHFFARQLQGLEQGIGQGIHQNGQADAQGGSAYLVGGNGPAYVKNGATAGTVNQNGQADQQGQQSGTQSLQQSIQNLFGRAIQEQDQGVSQGTTQTGSADAEGGDVKIVGGWSAGPVTVDASSHAGVVDQDSTSNQKPNQNAAQTANKENINQFWARQIQAQAQGNTQNVNTNADVSATASPKAASGYFFTHHPVAFDNTAVGGSVNQDVQANQANKQGASQNANNYKNIQVRAIPSALNYGAQSANADAQGGSSYSYETNDKIVNGNGLTSVQGGPQTSNGSAAAGTIKQLLQL
ncbi:hypothetical protein NDA11_003932 [Ustilago hordei]|nr:hypothetical protein NDA11_003932 [Ustilago hordei]